MFDSDFEIFGFSVLVTIVGINAATLFLVKKFINSTQTVQESKNTNKNTQVIVEEPSQNVSSSLHSTKEFSPPLGLLSSQSSGLGSSQSSGLGSSQSSGKSSVARSSNSSLGASQNSKLEASQNSKLEASQNSKLRASQSSGLESPHPSGLTNSALIEEKILQRV